MDYSLGRPANRASSARAMIDVANPVDRPGTHLIAERDHMSEDSKNLNTWLDSLSDQLQTGDLQLGEDEIHTVLDLARDAAHEVVRPAAPLTTFLVGVAVGRGATLGAAAAKATILAQESPVDTDTLRIKERSITEPGASDSDPEAESSGEGSAADPKS